MNIISVDNNWPNDVLYIDINIGNICNYKCWYCWPNSNTGDQPWPDLETLKTNIAHLIVYYKEHTNKQVFDIHFCGGEPTHWPKLGDFIKYCKENFNCLISMTSNGSKKRTWWNKYGQYFDRIHMSCHHEYVKIDQYRDLCDDLVDRGVVVSVSMMMDPHAWDECIKIVEQLKQSKRQWTIRYVDIIDPNVTYNEEQYAVLQQHRARRVNPIWFWRHNKYYVSKVTVVDDQGKKHRFNENEILLKKMNNFYGWECSVGVNWVDISSTGRISGTCGQILYNEDQNYNLYDADFAEKFQPTVRPSICTQTKCVCNIETVMPKKYISNNKKVIPIRAY